MTVTIGGARPGAGKWAFGAAAALFALVRVEVSWAQDVNELSIIEVVDQCSKVTEASERLECYDALAASLGSRTATDVASDRADEPERVAEATASASEDAEPAEEPSRRFIIMDAGSVQGKKVVRESKRQKGEPFSATVIAAKHNNIGRLFVQFDDGQIWRTMDGAGEVPLPAKGETVQLKKTMFFSWWVTFENGRRVKMVPFRIDD